MYKYRTTAKGEGCVKLPFSKVVGVLFFFPRFHFSFSLFFYLIIRGGYVTTRKIFFFFLLKSCLPIFQLTGKREVAVQPHPPPPLAGAQKSTHFFLPRNLYSYNVLCRIRRIRRSLLRVTVGTGNFLLLIF